jgi:hypothetical protein
MKIAYPIALAAALVFACSSGSKNTRTAGNDTGVTQSGSVQGTQGTAGGANGAQGSSTATAQSTTNPTDAQTANNSTGTDANTPGSVGAQGTSGSVTQPGTAQGSASGTTYGQSGTSGTVAGQSDPSGAAAGQSGTSGSTYGQSGTSSSGSATMGSGSTYGQNTASGSASVPGSSDNASLRTVTGAVAKVDENSITLDQAAGGVTLTIDSQTQVIRRGQPIAAGISAIHEGTQVRASFDPASNRADKIEVMGKAKRSRKNTDKVGTNPSGTAQKPADTTPDQKK